VEAEGTTDVTVGVVDEPLDTAEDTLDVAKM
jgi:hypothetical protein